MLSAIADLIRERKAGTVDAQLAQDAIGGHFRRGEKDLQVVDWIRASLEYVVSCRCI